jgi:AcrR family transcriptional regulator
MKKSAPHQPPALVGNIKVTKADWIQLALKCLVHDGIDNVKVLPLSEKLGVSRSSFYWYFESRQDLLDELLAHWQATNTQAIIERAKRPSKTITQAVLSVFECWADEELFSPSLDFAVREWSRKSAAARSAINAADKNRTKSIMQMYIRHGYEEEDALIRARILYFMQIGFYVVELNEPLEARIGHVPSYLKAFTGVEPNPSEIEAFASFVRKPAIKPKPANDHRP